MRCEKLGEGVAASSSLDQNLNLISTKMEASDQHSRCCHRRVPTFPARFLLPARWDLSPLGPGSTGWWMCRQLFLLNNFDLRRREAGTRVCTHSEHHWNRGARCECGNIDVCHRLHGAARNKSCAARDSLIFMSCDVSPPSVPRGCRWADVTSPAGPSTSLDWDVTEGNGRK